MAKFTLLTTLFNDSDHERNAEYITFMKNNINNIDIENIIVIYKKKAEKEYVCNWMIKNGIAILLINNRPSFQDFFEYSNKHLPDQNIVLVNADIYLDFSFGLDLLRDVDLNRKFLVLTRYHMLVDVLGTVIGMKLQNDKGELTQ